LKNREKKNENWTYSTITSKDSLTREGWEGSSARASCGGKCENANHRNDGRRGWGYEKGALLNVAPDFLVRPPTQ